MKTINLLLASSLLLGFPKAANAQCSLYCHGADLKSIASMNGHIYNDANGMISMHMRTTAATGSRITGQTDLDNNGASFVYTDSLILNYSGTHGGDLNHLGIQLKYDNAYIYSYNTTSSAWEPNGYQFQTFDASDHQIATVAQARHASTSSYINSAQELYTWGGSNLQYYVYQSWDSAGSAWKNVDKYIYTYDGSNNIVGEVHQVWNSSTSVWVNDYEYSYTYNVNNKVTMEVDQVWDGTASTWVNQHETSYTYDASNNYVLSQVYKNWNSGTSSWDVTGQVINTYDLSNNKLTSLTQEWTGTIFVNYSLSTFSDFVAQLPQTEIYQMWNTTTLMFENSTKYTYTYNAFNQLTDQISQAWNIGGFWQYNNTDRESRFHYQTYTTGVEQVAAAEGSVILYPVPATDKLNIDLQWSETQPFTVWLYNVQGIVLDKWDVAATSYYYEELPLNLPTGNYFIRFSGANNSIVKQFLVAR